MKRFISQLTIGLCLLLGVACQKNDAVEPFIEVSQSNIEVDKEATSASITVITNQDEWTYILPEAVSWFSIEKSAESLDFTFTENTTEEERTASILLRAGVALQRLTIKQKGLSSTISLDTAEILFSSLGEEKNINLGSSVKNAKVELLDENVTWLMVRKIANGLYSVRAEAQAETSSEARQTKLIITVGKEAKEVSVIQEGHRYYMLPIIKTQMTVPGMVAEEEARGSQITRTLGGNNLRYFHFAANARMGNPGFIEYDYAFMEDELYTKASVVYKGRDRFEGDEDGLNPDFVKFMKGEGFSRITKDDLSDLMFIRIPSDAYAFFAKTIETTRFVAYLTRINSNVDTRVDIRHEQVEDVTPISSTTFKRMPLIEQVNWLGSKAYNKRSLKKKADIIAYEEALGSTYDTANSGNLPNATGAFYSYFKVKPTEENPETGRGYITIIPGKYWISGVNITINDGDPEVDDVEGVLAAYDDISYIYGKKGGERVVTAEAKKLFADNGFPYTRRQADGSDLFLNTSSRIAYIVDVTTIDGKQKLRIRVTHFGS